MSSVSIPPVTARDGLPCANCRAPLAGDQRYCLQCGTRREDAAGTSLDALVAASAPGIAQTPGVAIVAGTGQVQLAPAPANVLPLPAPVPVAGGGGYYGPPEPPKGVSGWVRSNGPFISLGSLAIGVLIVGLLLGHWSAGDSAAPSPTTIKMEVTGLSAAPAAAAATPTPDASADSSDSSSDSSKDSSSDATDTTPVVIPKGALNAKDLTPAQIEKAGKAGKTIVTTGKKVPKDNKPAGGGSATIDIG